MATGEPDPLFTFHCADYTVKNNTTAGYCLQLFILKEKKRHKPLQPELI